MCERIEDERNTDLEGRANLSQEDKRFNYRTGLWQQVCHLRRVDL